MYVSLPGLVSKNSKPNPINRGWIFQVENNNIVLLLMKNNNSNSKNHWFPNYIWKRIATIPPGSTEKFVPSLPTCPFVLKMWFTIRTGPVSQGRPMGADPRGTGACGLVGHSPLPSFDSLTSCASRGEMESFWMLGTPVQWQESEVREGLAEEPDFPIGA